MTKTASGSRVSSTKNVTFIDVNDHRERDLRFNIPKNDDNDTSQQNSFDEISHERPSNTWDFNSPISPVVRGRGLTRSMLNVSEDLDSFSSRLRTSHLEPTNADSSTLLTVSLNRNDNAGNADGSCFQVVIRLRPTGSAQYLDSTGNKIVEVVEDMKTLVIGKDLTNMHTSNRFPADEFTFDRIFDEYFSQGKFFQKCITPMMNAFFKGVNCTVLGYGQTRAGKSYTFTGEGNTMEHEKRGIVPRVTQEIFRYIKRYSSMTPFATKYTVKASYVQIYNECISDLLNFGHHNLKIVENTKDTENPGVIVGLRWEELKDPSDIFDIIKRGRSNRSVPSGQSKPPDLHMRSHTVLTIVLEQHKIISRRDQQVQSVPSRKRANPNALNRSMSANQTSTSSSIFDTRYMKSGEYTTRTITSKFNFVELAGSEKSKEMTVQTSTHDNRMGNDDGSRIARAFNSLLTVVSSFSRKGSHIPYRDSKLCYVIKDSLNDDSLNLFVAHLFPLPENYAECLSTVKYASRLRQSVSLMSSLLDPPTASSHNDTKDFSYYTQVNLSNSSNVEGPALDFKPSRIPKVAFSTMDESDTEEIETRRQLKRLHEELTRMGEEKRVTEKQCRDLKLELENTSAERDELKKHLLGQISDLERNSEEVERLRKELDDVRSAAYSKQEEKELLQKDLLSRESEQIRDRQDVELLKNEIIYIKNELIGAREARDISRREKDELQRMLEEEKEKRKTFEIGTEHWKEEFQRVEEERVLAQRDLVEIGRKFASSNDENIELKQNLAAAKNDIDHLLRTREKLEFELQAASEKIQTVMRENDALNRDLIRTSIREDELSGMLATVNDLRADLELSQATNAQIREELRQAQQIKSRQDSNTIAKLQHEANLLKRKIAQTEQEALIRSTISDATSQAQQSNNVEDSSAVASLRTKIDILTNERDTLRSNLTESLKEISRITEEKDRITEELFQENEVSDESQRMKQILTEKIRFSRELSDKREQIQKQYEENQSLKLDIVNLRLTLQQMKSKCEKYEDQISRLQSTLHSYENEAEHVHEQEQSTQVLLGKISALQMQIVSLQRELEIAEKVRKEKVGLEKRMDVLQNDLQEKHKEIEKLERESEELHQRCGAYEKDKRDLQDEIHNLRKKIEALNEEKDQHNSEIFEKTREILDTQDAVLHLKDGNVMNPPTRSSFSLHFSSPTTPRHKDQLLEGYPDGSPFDRLGNSEPTFSNISNIRHASPSKHNISADLENVVSNIDLISTNTKSVTILLEQTNLELARERAHRDRLEQTLQNKRNIIKKLEEECTNNISKVSEMRNNISSEHEERERLKRIIVEKESDIKKINFELETTHFELTQAREDVVRGEEAVRTLRNDITELKSQIRSMSDTQDALQTELQQTRRDLEYSSKHRETAHSEYSKISKELKEAVEETKELKKQQRELELNLAKKDEERDVLLKQISSTEEVMRSYEDRIREKDNDIQIHLADVYRLRMELEDINDRLKDESKRGTQYEENNKSMLLQNANLKLEVHKAREETETMRQKLEKKIDEHDTLEGRTDKEREEMRHAMDNLQKALNTTRVEVVTLEEQLLEMREELSKKECEVEELEEQVSTLKNDLRGLNDEHDVLLKQLQFKEAQVQEMESQILSLRTDVQDMESQFNRERQSLEKLQSQYEQKCVEFKELLGNHRSSDQEKCRIQIERNHLLSEINKYQKELETVKSHSERLHKQLLSLQEDCHRLTIERDELRMGLVECKNDRNRYLQERDELQARLKHEENKMSQKNEEKSSLEAEVRRLNVQIGERNATLSEYEKRLRQMQTDLQKKNREKLTLKEELQMTVEEKNRLLVKLDDADRELQKVKEASNRTNRDLKSIINSFSSN